MVERLRPYAIDQLASLFCESEGQTLEYIEQRFSPLKRNIPEICCYHLQIPSIPIYHLQIPFLLIGYGHEDESFHGHRTFVA